ncbi:hypothetical protein ABTY20_02915 [Streptomyces sp. NPDC126497]|uniref:hypothetical protein n=1 Tax=Streptomyces sp. NPDC126497 TaxID=3155313 RepID=UPI00331F9BE6
MRLTVTSRAIKGVLIMMSSHWNALAAEAAIASAQIGMGATMLGKTLPQRTATYAESFFPLSIGFERAGKVILQVDSKLTRGHFLARKEMKKLSHDLVSLFDAVQEVSERRYPGDDLFGRPAGSIHANIVAILGDFATSGRYFHLDYLGGVQAPGGDAAARWWEQVVAEASRRHYSAARRRRDQERAKLIDSLFDGAAIVRDSLVNGVEIDTVEKAAAVNMQNEAAVPWCRMYTLQIARWLARLLIELGYDGVGDQDVPYFSDFFSLLNQDDGTLRSRKTWTMSHY